ncbi:hypothetical protein K439DRAFT_386795 [Ramaria rubella]|nr:hypothetical protein K439DRAFT_386795 [Ramaria rubella]
MARITVFIALACALVGVGASPTLDARGALDIFDPPILIPNATTVWTAGQSHNVTWDASNPPKSISNRALIELRTSFVNEFNAITLAADFSLLAGIQLITLPGNLSTRNDYVIDLFGDSGNISPEFTILAAE